MLEQLLKQQYENNDNFKVVDISNNKRCIIFCSSHGLWDYNEETFKSNIVKGDRYEWENLANNKHLQFFGRRIFIRDIHLHFYVEGINKKVCNIDKIIETLKPLCKGYEVTLVGYSAGGYLAILLGCVLGAKRVFSFGGQVVLPQWSGAKGVLSFSDFEYLYRHKDDPLYNKWFNLCELISSSDCKIYQFYAKYNQPDKVQAGFIKDCKNVYLFAMPSEKHGKNVWGIVYPYLFAADDKQLISYSASHKNGIKNNLFFALKFCGVFTTFNYLFRKILKRIKR